MPGLNRGVALLKLDRLISILVILLRKERVQAKELAQMFGVSVRTILRDVDAINLAGIPVVTYQGINGGIGIADGYRLDKSVLTSDELAVIISTLKGMAGAMPDSEHIILMEKLKNIMSSSQLESLNSKANHFVVDLSPWGGNELQKEKVTAIRKAIDDSREIEFVYTDSAGSTTGRRVRPYSLVLKGQKWYLYAWCLMRQDFRFFKLSRIKELTVLEITFERQDVSLEQLQWENEWYKPENMIELELVFERGMKSIVEEWFVKEIFEHEDGRLMVKALLPENNWLYGFLLSFGMGVEVKNPPHIRKILAEIAEGICKKYLLET